MPPWKIVVFDGEDEHPMASVVLKVMQAVYRHFDPLRQPMKIDHWWFSPSLSHQVDEGSSEPKIILLTLREGQPDSPAMDTHFMINLNTSRIHDKFKDVRFPCPVDITPELEEIRRYVRGKVARENYIKQTEMAQRKKAITEQRLKSNERLEVRLSSLSLYLQVPTKPLFARLTIFASWIRKSSI